MRYTNRCLPLPLPITNRSRISCINTNHSHNWVTSGESCRYVVAFTRFAGGGIWLPQKSLRHILAFPGYAPGTIAVNVTWMKRGFNACQTHCSMYPSIFNRFPVSNSTRKFKSSPFQHIFAYSGYAPGTIAINVTRLKRGFNACEMPRCICPSIFNHF